ncbi:AMP-binding protein [Kribbella sp. NPDC051952]|uniref:AMP-binding protein n=1 Tax=Kribbella sp. NPDC051952 TaxID=3154851 RepID=UPI003446CB7D
MPADQPPSFARILSGLAKTDPDRTAIVCAGERVSRAELERRANRLARAYLERGVQVGDFVSIVLPNSIEFYVALVAAWKVGAVPAPLSARMPAGERDEILKIADPRLVVGLDTTAWPSLPAGYLPAHSEAPLPDRISPAWKAPASGGSTGRPKLIVAGQPSVLPADTGKLFHQRADDRQLVAGPLYHNSPLTFSSLGLFLGQELVVLPSFDAVAALKAIERHRITWVNVVPTMMLRMLRAIEAEPGRYDVSSLRILWHMAAPCPDWLKQAWIELIGPDAVIEMYGSTESIAYTVITGTEWLTHRGSVGRPLSGEITILDAAGKPAPAGEVGEVFMRSVIPMYHYKGAEARRHGDWESVGDLGRLDDDGFLYLSDRRTDLILSGGANVYPAEVEAAIAEHPAVLTCAVVGLPDADLGQRVHAVVQTAAELTETELLAYLAERLVRYKIPRSVDFVDQPLRSDAGKVRRGAVRDAAIERLGGTVSGKDSDG